MYNLNQKMYLYLYFKIDKCAAVMDEEFLQKLKMRSSDNHPKLRNVNCETFILLPSILKTYTVNSLAHNNKRSET